MHIIQPVLPTNIITAILQVELSITLFALKTWNLLMKKQNEVEISFTQDRELLVIILKYL